MGTAVRKGVSWIAVVAVLLLAAGLRLWNLGEVPPGLAHDEVAHWLIAEDILNGNHAIYFTDAYGQEPLYNYGLAGTVALIGSNWLALRWLSVMCGLLGIAVTWALMTRMFNRRVALLAALGLAVGFWPLFYGRATYRAILLPVIAGAFAYFLWRAIDMAQIERANAARRDFLFAGALLGLSFYTYLAARILPIIAIVALIYLLIVVPSLRRCWPGLVMMLAVAGIVAVPLLWWLNTHPDAQYRVDEVNEPLTALQDGDPSLVLENLVDSLAFFTFEGDPWPRQNVPGRPVFPDLLTALLFYGGVGWSVWHWREGRYGFLLVWTLGALGPSVATSIAPNSVRIILGLVTTFVFPALALDALYIEAHKRGFQWTVLLLAVLAFGIMTYGTVRDYFFIWPENEVVQFDHQTDLTRAIHIAEENPEQGPYVLSGLSFDAMDVPTLRLTATGDSTGIRMTDVRQTIVLPDVNRSTLLVPEIMPLDGTLGGWLVLKGMQPQVDLTVPGIAAYRLPSADWIEGTATQWPELPVVFGDALTLVSVEYIPGNAERGEMPVYLTVWRVERTPASIQRVFLHFVDIDGQIVAQFDGLQSNPDTWSTGDVVVQVHPLGLPDSLDNGPYALRVGIYDPVSGVRLPVTLPAGGSDMVLLMLSDGEFTPVSPG